MTTTVSNNPRKARLVEILDCSFDDPSSKPGCGFSQEDPKAAYFAAGKAAADLIVELEQQNLLDVEVIRKSLRYENDDVKAAALQALSKVEPDGATLDAMMVGIGDSNDPSLVEPAINYALKFTDPGTQRQIAVDWGKQVVGGATWMRHEMAAQAYRLINDQTVAAFEKTLNELNPQSVEYRSLKQALAEFARKKQGG